MDHRFDRAVKKLEDRLRQRAPRRLLGQCHAAPRAERLDLDVLAREVALGLPRRELLRRLGTGLAAALLASLGLDPAWAAAPCPPGQEFCTNPDRCCPPHWTCCNPHCLPPDYTCCPGPGGLQICPPGQSCVNGSCLTSCPANTSPCTGSRGNSCCNIYHQSCCQGQCCDDPQATCCNDGCHPSGSHCCPEGGACPNGQDCCQGTCCPPGQSCVNAACSSGCPTGQTLCGTSCVDTRTDPNHCGNCTTVCSGNTICSGGQCVCPPAQFCADQRPGMSGGLCCAPTEQCHHNQGAPLCLPAGCPSGTVPCQGRCVSPCSRGKVLDPASCQCVCPSGLTDCGGTCVDEQNDPQHYGSCGKSCPNGQSCRGGQCVCTNANQCPAGQGCCSGTCTPLDTSQNCGACGSVCASGVCSGGVCTCTSSTQCSGGKICVLGKCQCPPNKFDQNGLCCGLFQGNCGGVCTDLTSTNNCGACGMSCPANSTCSSGQCQCNQGFTAINGICKRPNFSPCASPGECAAGFCTNAICCIPAGQGPCSNLAGNDACCSGSACINGVCACDAGFFACGSFCCDRGTETCVNGMCHSNVSRQ